MYIGEPPLPDDAVTQAQLVLWSEDRTAPREWLVENIPGAAGLLCMLTDKANSQFSLKRPIAELMITYSAYRRSIARYRC